MGWINRRCHRFAPVLWAMTWAHDTPGGIPARLPLVLLGAGIKFRIFSNTSAPFMSNSVQVTPLISTGEVRWSDGLLRWQKTALLLLIAWLYAGILERLFLQWVGPHSDPNFEHGIFVPIFAAFVLWQDRHKLKALSSVPSWTGVPLVLLSGVVLVLGVLGADIFLPRVSLLILLAGLIILFQGWTFFRAVLFPWAFLSLMIPIPTLIINRITFPLQLLAAKLAAVLLELVGVPVLRQGNVIGLAAMQLDVVEACSGIRSLLTLVTLAIIYGYLMETRTWVRVTLVALAAPIAVAANSFRIFGTGLLVQYWDPDKAEGFYHALSGVLIFVVALLLLFAAHRLILLFSKPSPAPLPALAHLDNSPASEVRVRAGLSAGSKTGSFRFAIVAVPMLATAIGLQAHANTEIIPAPPRLASLPSQIDGWTGTDEVLNEDTLNILGHPDYVMRDFENSDTSLPWINLYVVYFASQKAGDTIHSPDHCLPGAGWIPISREKVQLARPDGSSIPVNRYVVSKLLERRLVLYWFQAHGRVTASEWAAKYYLISDSIRMNRSDGGMVRLMSPMYDGESADAAQARVMKLGSQFLPVLDNYIPR
jgi:exosortase D (VPLPA-CTERM-specific)